MAVRKDRGDARPARVAPGSLIVQYERIAALSRDMLEAAQAGDWNEVNAIERRCRETIAALKQASTASALSDAENRRRLAILRSILKDDAQIRLRAEPWLRDLENLLAGSRGSTRS